MRQGLLAVAVALPTAVAAEDARVVGATAAPGPDGWRFEVTVESADSGWDKYANGWEVLAPDGTRLGYRELLHPHVDEQPFTRSLESVAVPEAVEEVLIRAHDSVTGWGAAFRVELPD